MLAQKVVAVDPGREKCGLAVVDRQSGALWHQVTPTPELAKAVARQLETYSCRTVVLGDQTYSDEVRRSLGFLLTEGRIDEIVEVDEHGSTEVARSRYWRMNPPQGWRRFVPIGLLVPPCAIDDVAAIILGERYFQKIF